MNRAFEDSDLMAQSQDLDLEVKARTKDRTQSDDQCDEKCEQGSGHRKENIRKEVPAVRLSARLHPCCVDPHTNLGQMDSSIESPDHPGAVRHHTRNRFSSKSAAGLPKRRVVRRNSSKSRG